MFDSAYFNDALAAHLKAAGGGPSVEMHLAHGHVHRVRSIVETAAGYVVVEAYRHRIDGNRSGQQWEGPPRDDASPADMVRAVIAYESIIAIVITPADDVVAARIGFGRPG